MVTRRSGNFLREMRQTVVEGIQHQDYPFPLLVEKLQPDRDFSRTPIFQTVFILQKFKQVAGLEDLFTQAGSDVRVEFGGLVLEPFPIPQQEGQFELSVELAEKGGVYQGVIKYDTDLFDASTMRRLSNHYRHTPAIDRGLAGDQRIPAAIAWRRTEREELVAGVNATDQEYARERDGRGPNQGAGGPATGSDSGEL